MNILCYVRTSVFKQNKDKDNFLLNHLHLTKKKKKIILLSNVSEI